MATSFYQNVFIVEILNKCYKTTDESIYDEKLLCGNNK